MNYKYNCHFFSGIPTITFCYVSMGNCSLILILNYMIDKLKKKYTKEEIRQTKKLNK